LNDRIVGLLYVSASVILESLGQISLKHSAERNSSGRGVARMLFAATRDKWLTLGIVCFVFEFGSWTLALQRLDVSLAYQLSCLTVITVTVSSRLWLAEKITGYRWIGLICIFLGSILVGAS
jgi:multidrug transporter EmrE-like cation transporter